MRITTDELRRMTNCFRLRGVKLNLGKQAIWRIESHEAFRGTWLSDHVPNRLEVFWTDACTKDRRDSDVGRTFVSS